MAPIVAAGKNENKEKKKVNGGRESCGSGKGVCGNFYFYFFLSKLVTTAQKWPSFVGTTHYRWEIFKKNPFPPDASSGRECPVAYVRIIIRIYYGVHAHTMNIRGSIVNVFRKKRAQSW